MNTPGLTEFFEKNWKPLVGLFVAVLVVVGALGAWKEYSRRQEVKAADLLFELQATQANPKAAAAEAALQPLFDKFPSSRASCEATLQVGDLWMEEQGFAEAAKRYEKAETLAKDSFSKLLARYNLGIAQEAAGKYQEAVASYGSALSVENSNFLQPEIMLAQARCYEALQQASKALDLYKEIQAKFATQGAYYTGVAAALANRLSANAGVSGQ